MRDEMRTYPPGGQMTRRSLLGLMGASGVLAAACAPAAGVPQPAAPAAPSQPAQPAWQKEWDELVAAGRKEGLVVYDITRSNSGARAAIEHFKKAIPGIEVEQTTSAAASTLAEQVQKEQQAGVFSWDVLFGGSLSHFYANGSLAPLKPMLLRPDVLDNAGWRDGFDAGWVDREKRWGYAFQLHVDPGVWVNGDQVGPDEIIKPTDLLNPKWRGRIVMADPRVVGFGYVPLTVLRLRHGQESMDRLLTEQKVILNRDTRQITEQMVRGQHAIAFGVVKTVLEEFKKEGLGKNIRPLPMLGIDLGKIMWLPKQVPHPNAAKVFINWMLGKEGQEAWCKAVVTNSRRTDVPVIDPAVFPRAGMEFQSGNSEEGARELDRTVEIAKELLK